MLEPLFSHPCTSEKSHLCGNYPECNLARRNDDIGCEIKVFIFEVDEGTLRQLAYGEGSRHQAIIIHHSCLYYNYRPAEAMTRSVASITSEMRFMLAKYVNSVRPAVMLGLLDTSRRAILSLSIG